MLDADLAAIYGVTTERLNQQVKRNRDRFPTDFMFRLTKTEAANLTLQTGRSSSGYGGRRHVPFVFTEHGALMLASVLRTSIAAHDSEISTLFDAIRRLMSQPETKPRPIGFQVRERQSRHSIRRSAQA